jgi:hypothetical protein
MSLSNEQILAIDKARVNGESIATIRASLAKAGLDPRGALEAYKQVPLGDGRLRGDVNLSDPQEWGR